MNYIGWFVGTILAVLIATMICIAFHLTGLDAFLVGFVLGGMFGTIGAYL